MPKTILTLILTALACVLSTASASASIYRPLDRWTASGPTAEMTSRELRAASMQYAFTGNPGDNGATGTWTMQASAPIARKLEIDWRYAGYHAYFMVSVQLEKFVIRDGAEIVTETLQSARASRCCTAPAGGFDYAGTTTFDVEPGDVYGFRMSGSNADRDRRLNGTLTLGLRDVTPPRFVPRVVGTLGGNGWYTSDVEVSWDVLVPDNYPAYRTCGRTTVVTDTAGKTVTCSLRGPNAAARGQVTIKRDTTGPTITLTGANTIGGTTIRLPKGIKPDYLFTSSDLLSGPLSAPPTCTAMIAGARSVPIASQTTGHLPTGTGICTATDNAGNVGTLAFDII